jgi:DNA-binding NarL/FixJ family response regulator
LAARGTQKQNFRSIGVSERRIVSDGAELHSPPSTPLIRILLVGRHRVVLDSIAEVIGRARDMQVISDHPDVTLFDLDDASDETAFDLLAKTAVTAHTIVLSISVDPLVAFRVFRAGARGLISKRQPPQMLLTAIRKVHGGEIWLGRTLTAQVLELARADRRNARRPSTSDGPLLTPRERQLITLVGEGWRNADIARHLVAGEATVRASLTALFRKLGVADRFSLMMYASQHGYVSTTARPRPRSLFPPA